MRSTLYIMRGFSLPLAMLLAGCGGAAGKLELVHDRVPVLVSTPCLAEGGKPGPVAPLNASIPPDQWMAKPVGAKARAVQAQAGRRMNYEAALDAATAGCR